MLVMWSLTAVAADPGPPPPPPPPASDLPPPPPPPPIDVPPQGEACVPECRAGYACQNGQCVPTDAPTAEPLPSGSTMVSDRGERAPPGKHWEYRRKVGLLITGPILFGVGYGLSVLSAISGLSTVGNRVFCFIPIAGPTIMLITQLSSNYYAFSSSSILLDLGFTVISTALQATGLLLGLLGIPKRQVLVDDPGGRRYDRDDRRDDDDRREERPRDNRPPPIQWSLAPFAPGADIGVSLLIRN